MSSNLYSLKRTEKYVQDQNTYKGSDQYTSTKTDTPLFQSDDREQNALASHREPIHYFQETPQHVSSFGEPLFQSQDPHNSFECVRAPEKETKSQDTIPHYSQPSKCCTSNGYYSPNMRNESCYKA